MSETHPFIQVTVEYHGNRSGVDLEATDGISSITCGPDYWTIRTKDTEHFNYAKRWPGNIILVTTTWCQSGASRRLIQVNSFSFPSPNTIVAHGRESLFGMGHPVSRMSAKFGHHKPLNFSKRTVHHFKHNVTPKRQAGPHQKREPDFLGIGGDITSGLGDVTSAVGGGATSVASDITSDAGSVATSVATDVTSGAESVGTSIATDVTSGAESVGTSIATDVTSGAERVGTSLATQITSGAGSVGTDIATHVTSGAVGLESTITSGAHSLYTVVTSDAHSVFTMVTDDIANLLKHNISKTMETSIHIPKATPTAVSPWGHNGEKLFTFNNMDFWDLGVQLSGAIEMEGDIEIYAEKVGTTDFLRGSMGLNGSDWKLNFPIGIDFRKAKFFYQNNMWQLMEPISLCPEAGCFAVQNIFELGCFVQLVLNITLNVDATGKIYMGTNNSYEAPRAIWEFGGGAQNQVSGWHGEHKKWFNHSDGQIKVEGSFGVDLQQYNGLNFPRIPMAQVGASINDGVSIITHIATGFKGNDHERRDMSKREHPKDILAREMSKQDTCMNDGGVSVELTLQEQVVIQAGLGPLSKDVPLWATQVPLTSTCFELAAT